MVRKLIVTGVILAALGAFGWWQGTSKLTAIKVIPVNNAYAVNGQVLKWFPNSDTLDVKVGPKTINLKLKEYPQTTLVGPNPRDQTNTTILVKSQYTPQEWERAFCKDDLLLIGTKENIWPKIKNYMQITPDFVNVEDRPCYNLPAK